MSSSIHDKIAKLLAFANDKRANESEAANALKFATALMLKHNISEDEIRKNDGPKVCRGDEFEMDKKWKEYVSYTCQLMYSVKGLWYGDRFVFVGRADNIDAAQQTYAFICDQVETLYKQTLPKGMSKSERAQYRRDFKLNCAIRVWTRANQIMKELMKSDQEAIAATGSTALVIVNKRRELEDEIEDFFQEMGTTKKKQSRAISVKTSRGGADGLKAGNNVQLNRSVQ